MDLQIMKKSNYTEETLLEEYDNQNFSIEFSKKVTVPKNGHQKVYNVLFVSSGNLKNFDLAPFIRVQGDSLAAVGVNVTYFKIKGKGIKGYLKNINNLKRFIKENDFDLIHAHFTLSGWVAALTFPKLPLVLSLMGTDALGRVKNRTIPDFLNHLTLLTYLIQPFVDSIISKSANIDSYVWKRKKSHILPNGVDLDKFDGRRTDYREELGLSSSKKYVLFLGNQTDENKNFKLLEEARLDLKALGFEVVSPYPVSHATIIKYLSSVDLVVMCSKQEGSPNVVKEAMASNCKGVFTDVGDVREIVGQTPGYAITSFDKKDLVRKIQAVSEMDSCEGRKRIISLRLDTENIANRLKAIYLRAMKPTKP